MVVQAERYLLVRVEWTDGGIDQASAQVLLRAVRDSIQQLFGDFGSGCIQHTLQVKFYSLSAGLCMVRVARRHANMVRTAITAVCFIQRQPVCLSVVHIAGSARTARRAMINRLEAGVALGGKSILSLAEPKRPSENEAPVRGAAGLHTPTGAGALRYREEAQRLIRELKELRQTE